tara:strand:+ start:866 stop:1084 length:219 start_codon:yes stop_codon:yes gene_type:complete
MKTEEEISSLKESRDYYKHLYEREKRCSNWLDALATHFREYANINEYTEEEEDSKTNVDNLYEIYTNYRKIK